MPITTADKKRRVVIPVVHPGDVFEVQQLDEGSVVLVRLVRPKPNARVTRAECLRAIAAASLRPKIEWEEIRQLTREP